MSFLTLLMKLAASDQLGDERRRNVEERSGLFEGQVVCHRVASPQSPKFRLIVRTSRIVVVAWVGIIEGRRGEAAS